MSELKGLAKPKEGMDGSGLSVGIIHTRWNEKVISALLEGCKKELEKLNVTTVDVEKVPGAFELPLGAKYMIETGKYDAIVCIGCLIKGETMHFEYISDSCSQGIMRLGLETGIPVIYGVLNCTTEHQALYRAGLTEDGGHNHGPEWGAAAVEMALIHKRLKINK